jgi:hypothetical protein
MRRRGGADPARVQRIPLHPRAQHQRQAKPSAARAPATRRDADGTPLSPSPQHRRLPMGYYSKAHLPVYDFLGSVARRRRHSALPLGRAAHATR